MSFLEQVIALLRPLFDSEISIYSNILPEGTVKPALVVTEVANSSNRVLEGRKTGVQTVWRVTIYVRDDSELNALLDVLESLDNTSNNDFQRIFSQYVLTEARQPQEILTRAFYDLTLYK